MDGGVMKKTQWRAVFSSKLERYPISPSVYPYSRWKHKLTSPPADETDIVSIGLIILLGFILALFFCALGKYIGGL